MLGNIVSNYNSDLGDVLRNLGGYFIIEFIFNAVTNSTGTHGVMVRSP